MTLAPEKISLQPAAGLRPIDQLPGPKAWPLLGHLLQLDLPQLHRQLEDWAAKHGHVYRIKLLRRHVVVLSDTEAISRLLRARPETWRRPANFEPVFRESGGHGLFSAEGEDWRRQRRMVMTAFDPAHLKSFMPHLVRVTDRLRARWARAAAAGVAADLQAELMCYSVDAASALSFGVDINTIEEEHSDLHEHLGVIFPMIYRRINIPFPYWRYVRLPIDRAYDRHVLAIHQTISTLVAQARQRLHEDAQRRQRPTDLLEAMLTARDADGSALTEEEMVGNVFTMLSASEDTTANSLAWTIYLLHEHRAAWDRLVQEVDALLPLESTAQSLEQARSLAYTEACINEAMRLRPVAPLLFFDAIHDTQVLDVAIPRGTTVFCLMRPGATDGAIVDDAHEYRPERWLDGGNAKPAHSPKRTSMPFGAGPRLCPGRYLAMLEMNMVLAMLARNFELMDVSTADGKAPMECVTFTMHPVGLKVRLRERVARIRGAG